MSGPFLFLAAMMGAPALSVQFSDTETEASSQSDTETTDSETAPVPEETGSQEPAPEDPEPEDPEPEDPEPEDPQPEGESAAPASDPPPTLPVEPDEVELSGTETEGVEAGSLSALEVVGRRRGEHDVDLFLRFDNNIYLEDEILRMRDLPAHLARFHREDPELRLVIAADEEADLGRLQSVVQVATDAGLSRVALDFSNLESAEAAAQLFPGDLLAEEAGEVTSLDQNLTRKELRKLKPKRSEFPQNPYGSTDFTAYTLEWGEGRVGLFNLDYGILPRTQVGTNPLFDVVGIYNLRAKINTSREGRLDSALLAGFYYVPVADTVADVDEALGLGLLDDGDAETLAGAEINVAELGAMGSLRLADPWSLHVGLLYSRVMATGSIDFLSLPAVLIPGIGDALTGFGLEVSRLDGELVQARVATDIRFNRRDSLVLQAQAPIYARARGVADATLQDGQSVDDVDFLVTWGEFIPVEDAYRVSLSWQFSWKHVDLRMGVGASPLTGSWALQAFQLAWRFGGKTRVEERRIRRAWRENRKELRSGSDSGDTES